MTRVLGADTAIGPLVRALRADGALVRVVPAGADKEESLARFGDALRFPEWYGHNYDALYDCLLAVVHAADGDVHVVWDGTAPLRTEHPDVFDTVVRLLSDAEDERPTFRATVVDR